MANRTTVNIHIKKSARTVLDALEKVGATVEGVDHADAKSHDASPPTGSAVHNVHWQASVDGAVRAELKRLEQSGELEVRERAPRD